MTNVLKFVLLLVMPWSIAVAGPTPVTVQRLGDLLVDRELRAPATVVAANRAVITSEVTALIDQVAADVGAEVRKGQLLIKLDDDNSRLALAQAQARLVALDAQIVEAKRRLAKAEELLARDFVSDDELIGRQTDLAVLEANRSGQLVAIQVAELALRRTRIRAPFDAAVTQRQAQVGSFAMPGTPLITIVQIDGREVDAELDPRYAAHLPQVSDLRFVSQGQEWPIQLVRLSSVIETDTRRLRGRFSFQAEAAAIGASGEIVWNEISGLVPVTLIVQRGLEFGVFVARNSKAEFVAIASAQEGRPAALNLPPETLIVSRGHTRLQHGDALQISRE